jgi:hypothetical protein
MKTKANNELFPVFLKLNDLNVLIIGGGTENWWNSNGSNTTYTLILY